MLNLKKKRKQNSKRFTRCTLILKGVLTFSIQSSSLCLPISQCNQPLLIDLSHRGLIPYGIIVLNMSMMPTTKRHA